MGHGCIEEFAAACLWSWPRRSSLLRHLLGPLRQWSLTAAQIQDESPRPHSMLKVYFTGGIACYSMQMSGDTPYDGLNSLEVGMSASANRARTTSH